MHNENIHKLQWVEYDLKPFYREICLLIPSESHVPTSD